MKVISNATLVNFSIFGTQDSFTSYEKQKHLAFHAVLENFGKRNCDENRIENFENYGFKGERWSGGRFYTRTYVKH